MKIALAVAAGFIIGTTATIATDRARHRGVRYLFFHVPPSVPTGWAPRFRRWENGQEVAP